MLEGQQRMAKRNQEHPRLAWHRQARFGISLHWGLYSIPARGEWVFNTEKIAPADYRRRYFETFNPAPGCCDAWAALAAEAGAKYCVLTAKHHDGFCLFDSRLTDFKATNTPARRDFIAEYTAACRKYGLRVGLYYSLVDWQHPDYPARGDRFHPRRLDPDVRERDARSVWPRYVEYLHGQVAELLSNYGQIDLLYFDFSYDRQAGERWGASALLRKIRALQPEVIVNDRLGCEALKQARPPAYAGDIEHTEQDIPRAGLRSQAGRPIPWEAWFTVNNSWGVNPLDREFKSAADIIRALVNCVSKDGNLLLNMSPDANGRIDERTAALLREVGAWLARNGESVHGCGAAGLPKPEWGRFTRNGKFLYAHLLEQVIGHVNLPGLKGRVKNGRVLATGTEAPLTDYWNPGIQTFDEPGDIFFNLGKPVAATFRLPDPRDTVVRFELTTPAECRALKQRYAAEFKAATAPPAG
jgi:alpha-L-fucosidase